MSSMTVVHSRGSKGLLLASVAILLAAACTSGSDEAERDALTSVEPSHAVGVVTESFVDDERPTKANGDAPAQETRTLETTVFYPAVGAPADAPTEDAAPDQESGPYPLIVFSHGYGANADVYPELLREWAAAGYVVAAPSFPLTNAQAPGGIDAGDYVNQPADVSFVISSVLDASEAADGTLSGLVEPDAIGVAGHSLGGITTLGAVANDCCQDSRLDAAVVMAGDPLDFPDGAFDYDGAPPILLVHGTDDALVTYEASVDVFNLASAPKGIVTISAGDHGAPVDSTTANFASVVAATTHFFDAYLKDDDDALAQIEQDGAGDTTVQFVAEPGATVTLPTTPEVVRNLEATVTPADGLVDGQTVTVDWSGFTPGNTINIVQCSESDPGDSAACDLKQAQILQPNPTGSGSLPLQIVIGAVGTGICDVDHPGCVVVVNDGGSLDPSASVRIPITFAGS